MLPQGSHDFIWGAFEFLRACMFPPRCICHPQHDDNLPLPWEYLIIPRAICIPPIKRGYGYSRLIGATNIYSKIFQLTWFSRIKVSSKISSITFLGVNISSQSHIPKMSLVQCWPFNVFSTIYLPQGHVSSIFHFKRFETILVMQSCHYEYSNF
jgi:hypothetical protein